MSSAHVIHLIEHSQVAYRIEHSAPVQAIVGTLLTTLVGLAVAAFFNRRRIAWRPYVDAPITLEADLAKTMGSRVIHKVYVADNGLGQGGQPTENGSGPGTPASPVATAEVQIPWLVLIRIRNSGRVTISGAEFSTPLTFTFPGREVRDVAVIDGAGDDPDRILVRPKKADPGPRTPAAPPGRFRQLAGWVRGRPAATAPAPSGTVQSVALNGLSGFFGNLGRLKNNYQYWTTECIYANGRPTGLAAAFLAYLSNAVGLNDLADAGYTPCRDSDHPSAARLCAQAGS